MAPPPSSNHKKLIDIKHMGGGGGDDAFASNRASFAQRQVTQEQLRATQEELATKIRELQIYEANYLQLKKDLTKWKKKFEYIFRENELLSLETAKLDASHKQIAFLQQEIKFKEEESEALRGLVTALEASNKKARASRLDSAARLAGRSNAPEEARAVSASDSTNEALDSARREHAAEKERLANELSALKSENGMLLKDLDRRESALQLSEDKILAHKDRIASLERSLQDEQNRQMQQLREKQDRIVELEAQVQQLERQRRRGSSAVSRDEAGFGPTHRLRGNTAENGSEEAVNEGENEDDDGEPDEPDTPPGTPPPISAGGLLPPSDPTADQIIRDWEEDKRIHAARSTDVDWPRLEDLLRRLPFEARDGAERILRRVLRPEDQRSEGAIDESQLLIRGISTELRKEFHDFLVPVLKAHKHIRVTYATLQRRTLVSDLRLTLEPRESEYTGGMALGEKRFGKDHQFFGPSHDDVTKLVLHSQRVLTTDKKAMYISKPVEAPSASSDLDAPTTPLDGESSSITEGPDTSTPTSLADAKTGVSGKKWLPNAITGKTKKLMGTMVAGAKQRVARLNQVKHVHEGTSCQFCKVSPIVGNRYSCSTCVGFDLCENCYALGGHGLENSDELFYRVQELVLARCSRLQDELDLLELLRFEICRSNLRKFSFCLNWLADIINGKTSQQLQARALEIPSIRRDIRKQFVPLLLRLCSDREDLEVKTEWELESDNSAEVKSVIHASRNSLNEGDGRFLETLRIWVADQYRTTSPFVERSLLKFREGGDGESDEDDVMSEGEGRDRYNEEDDLPASRRRAATAAARMSNTSAASDDEDRVASSRRGFTERTRIVSQEF